MLPGPVLGSTTPRLWTPPLRELTPATSVGFHQVEFARDVLGRPFDPWQEWLVVHAGELLPDGRPRFHKVLVIVARQNGKTEVPVILSLYWLWVDRWPLVLGTSTKLDYAQESWEKAIAIGRDVKALWQHVPARGGVRRANGEQVLRTAWGSRYKIAASNEEGGRSLSIDRLVLDELRQHRSYAAWDAAVPATGARPHGQVWALTNMGDDGSVVLNDLRDEALQFIETGEGDYRLGLFEWSAPLGSDPTDPAVIAMANPNAGRRLDMEQLVLDARSAVAKGGDKLSGFLTERLCIRVPSMDTAIDAAAWRTAAVPGTLDGARGRLAAVVDVAPDLQHAALGVAAVVDDGKVRGELVAAWSGAEALAELLEDLPGWLARIRPARFGWFPTGPAAALDAQLRDRRKAGRGGWPPAGVEVAEITGEAAAVCMGFAALVAAGGFVHSGQALLDTQTLAAERLMMPGERWVFTRRGAGHVDGTYAVAGAVHLARTMPTPRTLTTSVRVAPDV